MPTKGLGNAKRIPIKKIYQHFVQLPDQERDKLLRNHLSSDTIDQLGQGEFSSMMSGLRNEALKGLALKDEKQSAEIRKRVTEALGNEEKIGASLEDMLREAERVGRGHEKEMFKRAPKNPTPADKMFSLITSLTFMNRLDRLWPCVKDPAKRKFEKKGLAGLDNEQKLSRYLEKENAFAEGKNRDSFLSKVMQSMDLSRQKSTMEYYRSGIAEEDPNRREKLRRAARLYMLQPEGNVDPEREIQKLNERNWKTATDPLTNLKNHDSGNAPDSYVHYTREAIQNIPETDEDRVIFLEAALEQFRDLRKIYTKETLAGDLGVNYRKYVPELHNQLAQLKLREEPAKSLRTQMAKDYNKLAKVKQGFLMSTTNSVEHNTMTESLRILNAKLDILEGKEPGIMDPFEQRKAKDTDLSTLYRNAWRDCYQYGCLKTKYGTSGFFVYDDGAKRYNAAMDMLQNLNQLGKTLGLSSPAELMRDQVRYQLLKNGSKQWDRTNVADMAARIMCAQSMIADDVPWDKQSELLQGDALKTRLNKIKDHPGFRRMVSSMEPKALGNLMVRGVSNLAATYRETVEALQDEGVERSDSEIAPEALEVKDEPAGLQPHA